MVRENVRTMSDRPRQRGAQMARDGFGSNARIGAGPFYRVLVAFVVSCFLGTLATDIAYWRTTDMMWADFSDWLVTAGVVVGYVTILVALIEVFGLQSGRLRRPSWAYAIGNIVALILATLNLLVHTRDAWTSVVPWGVVLSAAVVVVALVTGWVTRETLTPHSAEVTA
jgi:uncharacterized membrane protein